ncbi:MAG: hypothetical protein DRI90_21105 [Deltaproteobacteria bacterium]|nr:MAG: hypothetical protein DRI90_21105 [Deltaproteobacteria bacterium]
MPDWPVPLSTSLKLWIAALGLLGACGGAASGAGSQDGANGGGRVEPTSVAEQEILKQLESLPSGKQATIGGVVVVADPPYFAASGRTCRQLLLTSRGGGPGRRRLGCKDGASWFYAPDVFATPTIGP